MCVGGACALSLYARGTPPGTRAQGGGLYATLKDITRARRRSRAARVRDRRDGREPELRGDLPRARDVRLHGELLRLVGEPRARRPLT